MYVKETPLKNGRVNISIVEGHWENGRTRMRTIKGFGYLDELAKKHEDPRAFVREECARLNEEKKRAYAPVTLDIYPNEKIETDRVDIKNIGSAIALAYYHELGIEKVIRNHIRGRRFSYDVNAVVRLLVLERLIFPSSKLCAYERKGHYFFRSKFKEDDIYRSLDFIASLYNPLLTSLNKATKARGSRDASCLYYDVTNYYFEIDNEDSLRERGVSKEHRRDPIVQMGLLQDRNGIPLSYRLFSGNTRDPLTLIPSLLDIQAEIKHQRTIIVADKGINSKDNIASCLLSGCGFIFSQSIRGTKSSASLRDWVVSDEGYKPYVDISETGFKIKSTLDDKTLSVTDKNGKSKKVDIEVKIVAFFSPKYAARARKERLRSIEKAKKLIESPSSYERANHYGVLKYIRNITLDKKTGEIIADAKRAPYLDLEAIAKEELLDGYYLLVTSEVKMKDTQILNAYRELWRIEEAFKVTKSCLKARPVYVYTQEHIQAHFLICYIALTIIRLIQKDTDFKYCPEAICAEIRKLNGVHLQDNWWRFSHRSELSDKLAKAVGIDLSRKNMQLSEIKQVLTQVKSKNTAGKTLKEN